MSSFGHPVDNVLGPFTSLVKETSHACVCSAASALLLAEGIEEETDAEVKAIECDLKAHGNVGAVFKVLYQLGAEEGCSAGVAV